MWSYYGSKANIVDYYPKPKHGKIIEPFAGSARYSLKYFEKEVLLVDKYEVVVKIWKWLQLCSPGDITKLPRPGKGGKLADYSFDCEEAKMLMGFLVSKGVESPRLTVSNWVAIDRPNYINFSLNRIAKNLFKIKHWLIVQESYENIYNQEATWFIDPPYEKGGHAYPCSSLKINFLELGGWCRERNGQVIVCESSSATWMDFKPFAKHKGRTGIQKEGIWCNEPTAFDMQQGTIFPK